MTLDIVSGLKPVWPELFSNVSLHSREEQNQFFGHSEVFAFALNFANTTLAFPFLGKRLLQGLYYSTSSCSKSENSLPDK